MAWPCSPLAVGREVGVDVEWPRRRCDPAKLIHRYFSEDERREWHALPAAEKLAGFFRGWTCKEAWLKAVGTGLSFPLDQVSVSLAPHEPPRVLSIRGDHNEAAQWHLACSIPADGYVAAVAVRSGRRASIHGNGSDTMDAIPDDPGRRRARSPLSSARGACWSFGVRSRSWPR